MKVSIHIDPWAVSDNGITLVLVSESVSENTLLELASRKQITNVFLGGYAATDTPETKTLSFSLRDTKGQPGVSVQDKAIA